MILWREKITYSCGQRALRWADENRNVNMMREYESHLEFITAPSSLLCHSSAPTVAPSSPPTTCRSAIDCLFSLVLCQDLHRRRPAVQKKNNPHHSVSLTRHEYNFTCSTNLPQLNKTFISGFCMERKIFSPFICAPRTFFARMSQSSASLHLIECTSWTTNTGKGGLSQRVTRTPLMEVTKWTPS